MHTKHLVIAAGIALVLIALVSLGIIRISEQRAEATLAPATTAVSTSIVYELGPTVPVTKPTLAGQRSYESTAYGFALEYPEELGVEEYAEAYGAMSAIFKNATTGKAFQLYVTPYAEAEITDERFALDQPSGVRENARDFLVDAVRGTRFDGNNAAMGDTAEVWVINNGYLYEIATYKQFGAWLDTILQSWQFI